MDLVGEITDYSVFLDCTELFSRKAYVNKPRYVVSPRSRISYYVSKLTVDERAVQLHEDFADHIKPRLRLFCGLIEKNGVEADLDHFRNEITNALMAVPNLTIFDHQTHGVREQSLLFQARHQGAYKDALIFSSATAYANRNGLPRCIFVTENGKDFIGLQKIFSSTYPIRPMPRFAFASMVQFDVDLYDNYADIVSRLHSKLVDQAEVLRREWVKTEPEEFAPPEAFETMRALRIGDANLSSILVEVRDISITPKDVAHPKRPIDVDCAMSVRYAIPNVTARLYYAYAEAKLLYSGGDKLADVEVKEFRVDWEPYA